MPDDAAWKPGRGQKIIRLYAWIAEEADGGEGLCAVHLPGMPGWTPLIGADRARVESYREMATTAADGNRRPIRLVVFENATVLDEVEPR